MSNFALLETLKSFVCQRCKLAFASFDSYKSHCRNHAKLYSLLMRNKGRESKPTSADKLKWKKDELGKRQTNEISPSKVKSLKEKTRLRRMKDDLGKRQTNGIGPSKLKSLKEKARLQRKKDYHGNIQTIEVSPSKLKSLKEKARQSSKRLKVSVNKVPILKEITNASLEDEETMQIPYDTPVLSRQFEKTSRNKTNQKVNKNKHEQYKTQKVKTQGSREVNGSAADEEIMIIPFNTPVLSRQVEKTSRNKTKQKVNKNKHEQVKTIGSIKANGTKANGKIAKHKVVNRHRRANLSEDLPESVDIHNSKDLEFVDVRFDEMQKVNTTAMKMTGPLRKTRDGRYKCRVCEKICKTHSGMKLHEDTHDRSTRVRCNICLKDFASKTNLGKHMRKHTGLDRVKCEVCKREFNQKIQLQLHMRMHTGEKNFQCQFCKKLFTRKAALINHEVSVHQILSKTHGSNTKIVKCTHCDKIFPAKAPLIIHERSHVGEKPHKCETCGKGFNHKSNLTEHARIHSDVRPYPCDYCGWRFRFRSNLKQHLQMHLDIRSFECQICGRKFILKTALETHLRIHVGKQPYHCQYCKIGSRWKKAMEDHIKLHHDKEEMKVIPSKNLECSKCHQTFSHDFVLAQHMNLHTEKYVCHTCNVSFRSATKLKNHLVSIGHKAVAKNPNSKKIHRCTICKAIFWEKETLKRHMNIHPLKCYICDVDFANEDKLKAHKKGSAHKQKSSALKKTKSESSHKGHQCSTCNKTYPTMVKLTTHMNATHIKFKCHICSIQFLSEWALNQHKEKKKHVQIAKLQPRPASCV